MDREQRAERSGASCRDQPGDLGGVPPQKHRRKIAIGGAVLIVALVAFAISAWMLRSEERLRAAENRRAPASTRSTPSRPTSREECAAPALPPLGTRALVDGHQWSAPLFLTQPEGVDARFVVEQSGRVQAVLPDGTVETFLDLSARVEWEGEQGLLGLAFHPAYAQNGRFFVYYVPRGGGRNIVAEYRRSAKHPYRAYPNEHARLVDQRDPESNHNGGMIAFGPDGYLYVGMGDGGGAGDRHGRRGSGLTLTTLLGKLLRLDVDNAAGRYAAAGNPLLPAGGLPQLWAYGLRNPWRFSFDRATGDLYIADVGQNEWEEIDFTPAGSRGGENYGWRAYEADRRFDAALVGLVPVHTAPVLVYGHLSSSAIIRSGCSVTGGYVYRGSAIPALRGYYLFGDWCSDDVAGFVMCGGGVHGLTRIDDLSGRVSRLASFGEDRAGELYLLGSDVLRIVAR